MVLASWSISSALWGTALRLRYGRHFGGDPVHQPEARAYPVPRRTGGCLDLARGRGRRGQRGSSLRPSGQAQPHPPGRRHFYRRLFDFVFVQALVAETKGCSLEQIEADLREKASFASGK